MRRVVVTGLGVCCPLGTGVRHVWKQLLKGRSGIKRLPNTPEYEGIASQVAGFVPSGAGEAEFRESDWVVGSERKRMNLGSLYSLCAANEALEDAGWKLEGDDARMRTGISVGSSLVDFDDVAAAFDLLKKGMQRKITPFFIPRIMSNMHAGHISIRFNIQGPTHSASTACTTGAHCIGDAAMMIARGHADVMVAGGTEHCKSPLVFAAFCRASALSTKFNDSPQEASRPFDSLRDGFVVSEGAGTLVLEELEHAKQRGAQVYAELLGYGMSGDAHHITAPPHDGRGAISCMRSALNDAELPTSAIGYINAHATSTPLGDTIENKAIKQLFGKDAYNLMVSSTKSATGHLLGAAGALEAIVTVLSVKEGMVAPTLNLKQLEPEFDLNYVPNSSAVWNSTNRRIAITNSFGFGGTNASLCFGEV